MKTAVVYPEIYGSKLVVTAIDGDMVTMASVAEDGESPDPAAGVVRLPFHVDLAKIVVGSVCYAKLEWRHMIPGARDAQ